MLIRKNNPDAPLRKVKEIIKELSSKSKDGQIVALMWSRRLIGLSRQLSHLILTLKFIGLEKKLSTKLRQYAQSINYKGVENLDAFAPLAFFTKGDRFRRTFDENFLLLVGSLHLQLNRNLK